MRWNLKHGHKKAKSLIDLGNFQQPLSPCTSSTPSEQIRSKLVFSTVQQLGIPWPSRYGQQRRTAPASTPTPRDATLPRRPQPLPPQRCDKDESSTSMQSSASMELITFLIHAQLAPPPPSSYFHLAISVAPTWRQWLSIFQDCNKNTGFLSDKTAIKTNAKI